MPARSPIRPERRLAGVEAIAAKARGGLAPAGRVARLLAAWPVALRHLLALGLGGLLTLAFAPYHAIPLIFVVFPGLALLIDSSSGPRSAALLGFTLGLGHMVSSLYWVGISFLAQDKVPAVIAPFAVAALAAYLAIYVGLAAGLAKALWRRDWRRPFVLAASWGLFEWLRGHLFTGFPWNPVSSIWTVSDVLLQPVAWIGSYGLSVLTVLLATVPVLLLDRARRGHLAALGVFVAFLIMVLAGAGRLSVIEVGNEPGITLRLVQANIPQTEKWQADLRQRNFVRHLTLSEASPFPKGELVVIWPETAVPYYLQQQESRRVLIGYMLPDNAHLITGAPRASVTGDELEVWNSLFVLDSEGRIAAKYDKAHLVPFGEYMPLRSLAARLGLEKLTAGALDFSAGTGPVTLSIPDIPAFSPLICYEVIFPGAVLADGRRPAWLLNLTNDGWYGDSAGPYQHMALARMRSVEEGLPLVRAAGTGISAVVDPLGRVRRKIALHQRGTIDSPLPKALTEPPLYARIGDVPAFALMALFFAMGLAGRGQHPRRRVSRNVRRGA